MLKLNYVTPNCQNCKYYIRKSINPLLNECSKFKWIFKDKIVNEYAITCRQDETKCGEMAYFFNLK